MQFTIKGLLLFGLSIGCIPMVDAQQKTAITQPTAKEIVQRAIDSVGGDTRLEAVRSAEFLSHLITAGNDTISLAIKRKGTSKFYISILSTSSVNSTTIFNNGAAVIIKNEKAEKITSPLKLEELQLQCYSSTDYGYKQLGYTLTRMDDQTFNNFDCHVVIAESPLGRQMANYYDKKTGHCIMTVYKETQGKTVFIRYDPYKELVFPTALLLADAKGSVTRSYVSNISINETTDDNWFNLPAAGDCQPPAIFKMGSFRYLNGPDTSAIIMRTAVQQVEKGNGQNTQHTISWSSSSDYILYRLKNPQAPPTDDNIQYVKARITAWVGNKYYCHYITSDNQAGTCAFEKVQ